MWGDFNGTSSGWTTKEGRRALRRILEEEKLRRNLWETQRTWGSDIGTASSDRGRRAGVSGLRERLGEVCGVQPISKKRVAEAGGEWEVIGGKGVLW